MRTPAGASKITAFGSLCKAGTACRAPTIVGRFGRSRNVFESGMQRLKVVFYTITPTLPMNFR